jgi:hypothetical protein
MVGFHRRLSRTLHALEDISCYLWGLVRWRHCHGTSTRWQEADSGARRVRRNGTIHRCLCEREDGKIRVDQRRNVLWIWHSHVFRVSKVFLTLGISPPQALPLIVLFFVPLWPVGDTHLSMRRISTISTVWITDITFLRTSIKFISHTQTFQLPPLQGRRCGEMLFGPL